MIDEIDVGDRVTGMIGVTQATGEGDDKGGRGDETRVTREIWFGEKGEEEREGLRTQFKIRLRKQKAMSISRFKEQGNHSSCYQMLSSFKP